MRQSTKPSKRVVLLFALIATVIGAIVIHDRYQTRVESQQMRDIAIAAIELFRPVGKSAAKLLDEATQFLRDARKKWFRDDEKEKRKLAPKTSFISYSWRTT